MTDAVFDRRDDDVVIPVGDHVHDPTLDMRQRAGQVGGATG